jgi:CrcB protein
MEKALSLIIGGSIGTISRYLLGGLVYRFSGTGFPYGTLAVNLSGCLILGFLIALSETKFVLSSQLRTFLMIGFCGAFTTFSTLIFETDNLVKDGEIARAIINILVSVLAGFVLYRIGVWIGKII